MVSSGALRRASPSRRFWVRLILFAVAAASASDSGGAGALSLLVAKVGGLELDPGAPVFIDLSGTDSAILEAPPADVGRWFAVFPVLREYDNRVPSRDPFSRKLADIQYRAEPLGVDSPVLDLRAMVSAPGTRYFCRATRAPVFEGRPDPLHRAFPGYVAQVVARRGGRFVDYLGELLGTPFIWAPAILPEFDQVYERVGSDCASFVAYGMRRLGIAASPEGPEALSAYLGTPLFAGAILDPLAGLWMGDGGRPVRAPPLGSILHFGGHVAVFAEDRLPRGLLDVGDVVLQSLGGTPHRARLSDIPYVAFALAAYPVPDGAARDP
jgi:hypothetical protein